MIGDYHLFFNSQIAIKYLEIIILNQEIQE